jgi:hypothetical protein
VNWKETMGLLRSREDQYPLLMELKDRPDTVHPLETALQSFEKLEAVE